ncbi:MULTISPECIES: biotin--[acetyl-CoA-carboxylase] ligase [unclassified Arthrobacter]|uniref:biotin--[acetyl-CoA-carboxylase] ligase n=2 Tax=Arthrobacter TaxID=1663 RepID=UPI001E397D3E|nr:MULTISPECIES: biotin--[acetyl-CoA-carboxylase] ligase [unclassified Arthrobacter]MCC9146178.1 biotin--[acetyl-CoA-carboxylase] ligase [Arthrobacter sp. zg-Y919]MDK1277408.1 biotin--[acetyl-CoA-carboxylase] ligase [Arthrobacter sp. zg.Y919]
MQLHYSSMERPALDAGHLRAALVAPNGPLAALEVVEETGSTNADLADAARLRPWEAADLTVLTAELQTAGRGRMDRSWVAPERSSLFVSVLLRPVNAAGRPLPTTSYGWLSLLAALAMAESVAARTGVEARLKWPNDVMVDGRKLAGVLAQLVPASDGGPPAVVVGAGLNVSLTDDDLPVPTATSLLMEYASTTDRNILLQDYLLAFTARYRTFCSVDGDPEAVASGASLRDEVTARLDTLGRAVSAQLPGGGVLTGRAVALAPTGALVIVDDAGATHTVSAADVVHLRPEPS